MYFYDPCYSKNRKKRLYRNDTILNIVRIINLIVNIIVGKIGYNYTGLSVNSSPSTGTTVAESVFLL